MYNGKYVIFVKDAMDPTELKRIERSLDKFFGKGRSPILLIPNAGQDNVLYVAEQPSYSYTPYVSYDANCGAGTCCGGVTDETKPAE